MGAKWLIFMNNFFVYVYVDHNTGNPIYIGKGCGSRDVRHIAIAKKGEIKGHLYNWIRKYYSINHKWPVPFKIADKMDEQTALDLERGLIDFYGRVSLDTGSLFNLSEGGLGNAGFKRGKLSPESIAKRTATILGRKWSAETKLKMSIAARGRKMSPEARVKISAAVRARLPQSAETLAKISVANKGKPSWNKGRTIPDDVKAKMSAAHKGKKYTAEQIAHYSVAATIREAKKRERLKLVA